MELLNGYKDAGDGGEFEIGRMRQTGNKWLRKETTVEAKKISNLAVNLSLHYELAKVLRTLLLLETETANGMILLEPGEK